MAASRPNVIYLHSHDSGREVEPYGAPVESPSLQRLAEDGVLFRHAFSSAPMCSPSRASLLTGQSAHSAGMLGLVNMGFTMPRYDQVLAQELSRAGYLCALLGIQHIGTDDTALGYERVFPDPVPWEQPGDMPDEFVRHADAIADAAIDVLRDPPDRPFFLDVGFYLTHRPYGEPDERDDPRWLAPPPTMPDRPETRDDFAGYRAALRHFDEAVGRILDALDASGLRDDTLVIATTDHGLPWPGMKASLLDSGIGVFLIMSGPEGWRGGRVVESLVSHVDVYPTICELAGIEIPSHVEGVSLVPLVAGDRASVRDEIFAELNYHVEYEPQRCVRTDRWKYIRRYEQFDGPLFTQHEVGPTRDLLDRSGYYERPYEPELLYDTLLDPSETDNLVGDPAHRDVLDDLRRRLDAWQEATHDPVLAGPVPYPAAYPELRRSVVEAPGAYDRPPRDE